MKLPNGYGSVFKMSGNRRKPWAARVPIGYNINGSPEYKYLGFFKTKIEGLQCLADYHNNTEFYNKITLEEVYKNWSKVRFKTIKPNTKDMYESNWQHFAPIKDMNIQDIRKVHLQSLLEPHENSSTSLQKQIKSLAKQLFKEALENDLVKQNYADYMEIGGQKPQEKEIFTDEEIQKLWNSILIENVDIPLILIYTGYRIGELADLKLANIDLQSKILKGGNKTEAGRKKIVGIHQDIIPLIERRYKSSKEYLIEKDGKKVNTDYIRKNMYYPALQKAGVTRRTPHTCRHTFASLLNRFVADKKILPSLMGHTDLEMTKRYTHADYKQMYDTVNLIKLNIS